MELRYIFKLLLKLTNIKLFRCEEISSFLSLKEVVLTSILRLPRPIFDELGMQLVKSPALMILALGTRTIMQAIQSIVARLLFPTRL